MGNDFKIICSESAPSMPFCQTISPNMRWQMDHLRRRSGSRAALTFVHLLLILNDIIIITNRKRNRLLNLSLHSHFLLTLFSGRSKGNMLGLLFLIGYRQVLILNSISFSILSLHVFIGRKLHLLILI